MTLLADVHRRYNPLRRSWVLCSPHRTQRPWQGQQENAGGETKPDYDPKCYLCPGNSRASGDKNPSYDSTYVFTNDFAAVNESGATAPDQVDADEKDLFVAERVNGNCKVVCFSPHHNLTLAEMESEDIVKVVQVWTKIYQQTQAQNLELAKPVKYCQIFENKGSAMGCSNPHPHGQCWLTSIVPDEPQIEHDSLVAYHQKNKTHLLEDYVAKELVKRDRIVDENESFVVLVPFWATWPFETMLLSKKRINSLLDLTPQQQVELAEMLKSLTVRYDNLFQTSFPYSMGIHQAFLQYTDNEVQGVEHLLFHFYPPLLRSATVRKFLVGFELLGMPQRDITPEIAAERLRDQSLVHYKST